MKRIFYFFAAIAFVSGTVACNTNSGHDAADETDSLEVVETEDVHDKGHAGAWSYEGQGGPEHWAVLSGDYAACNGQEQSPIDIAGAAEVDTLKPLALSYKAADKLEILNNGHTVQVNYPAGSTLQVAGKTYELKQFHFHSSSEHTVGGKSYPLEAHLVHKADDGSLAVVGVLFAEGAENGFLAPIWPFIPVDADKIVQQDLKFDVNTFLPADKKYYTYSGSLTTPPCSEGVRWLVLKATQTASADQITAIQAAMPENNRPVQPLGSRVIVSSK